MRTIVLGLFLLSAGLAGCARSGSSGPTASVPETTGQQAAESLTAGPVLTLEYLTAGSMSVWCAREPGQEGAVQYAFYADGTYRFGKPGDVVDGPGLDEFIRGVTVISREQDEFVVVQADRELVFTRGDCD